MALTPSCFSFRNFIIHIGINNSFFPYQGVQHALLKMVEGAVINVKTG